MNRQVWKQEIEFGGFTIPGGRVVHVGLDAGGVPCVWFEISHPADRTPQRLHVAGTGHTLPEEATRHCGTFVLEGLGLVFHVYELAGP